MLSFPMNVSTMKTTTFCLGMEMLWAVGGLQSMKVPLSTVRNIIAVMKSLRQMLRSLFELIFVFISNFVKYV